MKKSYTILRQGVDPDGGTWADYINAVGKECHIEVMAGLDLEERIQNGEEFDRKLRERRARMSPEELARIDKIAQEAGKRWGPLVPRT